MEFRHKYGVMGAGMVGRSLIGRLSANGIKLGPVAAVSYRVASRIANSLKGGFAAREPAELDDVGAVLFHAPPDQLAALLEALEASKISWPGRSLIVCDCDVTPAVTHRFRQEGASIAVARQFGVAGRVVLEGSGRALILAHRLARETHLKAVEIRPGSADLFDAAITLSTCAITPLIDQTAALLRDAGVRELDAPRLASALFEQAAAGYAHSGKQSWGWYIRGPEVQRILAQTDAAQINAAETGEMFRMLLLFGLGMFGKHPDLANMLGEWPAAPSIDPA